MRIALVAGEASGDLLGAGLATELLRRVPGVELAGVGGPGMRAAGVDTWIDSEELAVMGLAEVLRHLPRLLRLRRGLRERLLAWKPDAFVGIDAPDFNLGLERALKLSGIPTVHYVSPSVWAWREGRAAKIGRSADLVLCLFPMEPPIYARHGIDARFVGHPLADRFALHPDRASARSALGLDPDVRLLAVLPGSRRGELDRLLRPFLDAARALQERNPGLQLVIPAANANCRIQIERELVQRSLAGVSVIDGRAGDVMVAADAVLLASGTAALEALLAKRPMVVGYRISALTYHLVTALGMMRVERYSLPNVLANEPIVTELMQDQCTADNLVAALEPMLRDPAGHASLEPRYLAIHERLRGGGSASAAEAILGRVDLRR
ncbi:lipid-A-disaccharide synthase [soil metagenome]